MRAFYLLFFLYYMSNACHIFALPWSETKEDQQINKEFRRLVASDTILIRGGFNFVEGPVWHPDGYLLFSDIPESRIYRWEQKNNQIFTDFSHSSQSNGLSLDKNGNLIVCEHEGRRVTIRNPRTFKVLKSISSYQGKSLNSPNDVIVDSRGRLVFTDPPYGIGDKPDISEGGLGELFGVYQYDSGKITLLAKQVRPNGLSLSADGKVLYVADTFQNSVYAYDVNIETGMLSEKRKFLSVNHPDGVKVDERGFIYVAALEGVEVFKESGSHLGTIRIPEQPTNLTFGGENYDWLFITAQHGLYYVKLRTRGIAPFSRISLVQK